MNNHHFHIHIHPKQRKLYKVGEHVDLTVGDVIIKAKVNTVTEDKVYFEVSDKDQHVLRDNLYFGSPTKFSIGSK